MEKYYDKPHCQIFYLPAPAIVYIKWTAFARSEEFREACDFSLELLTQKRAYKMLADNREAKVFATEDQNWLTHDWFLRAFKQGYRVSAVLLSEDAFVKFALSNIDRKIAKDVFTVQYFKDYDSAIDWLSHLE